MDVVSGNRPYIKRIKIDTYLTRMVRLGPAETRTSRLRSPFLLAESVVDPDLPALICDHS